MDVHHIVPGRHLGNNLVADFLELVVICSVKDDFISPVPAHEAHGRGCLHCHRTVIQIRHLCLPLLHYLVGAHIPVVPQIGCYGTAVIVIAQHVGFHIRMPLDNLLCLQQHGVGIFRQQPRPCFDGNTDRSRIVRGHKLGFHPAGQKIGCNHQDYRCNHDNGLVV